MKKEKKELINVFNFSGGKTSAYMTIKYYKEGDIVIFCDTGREHAKTYKFINDFEAHEKIPVIRLGCKDSFSDMLAKKKYKSLPNQFKRFCTKELKIDTAKRFLREKGILTFNNYIGFRYDEPLRVMRRKQIYKKVFDVFPLYEDGTTKEKVNEFFKHKEYNLEIPSILGNCTLCFLKGKNAIINILRSYPEFAKEWIEDEELSKQKGNGHTYFQDTPYKHLLMMAENNLFKGQDLDSLNPAFSCSCTS